MMGAVVEPLLGVPPPISKEKGPIPSASWAGWGGTALREAEHPEVGVPGMDGIPGVDADLAISWGLLPTVQE